MTMQVYLIFKIDVFLAEITKGNTQKTN